MWAAATPLARAGVPPTAVTVAGVALAAAGAMTAPRAPALPLLLASAVCDGLDGAVAVGADRATRSGDIADKTADRISDALYALTLRRCGAPVPLVLAAAAAGLAPELRRLADPRARTRITVAERPTRLICALAATTAVRVTGRRWPATVSAGVATALGAVGMWQLRPGGPAGRPVPPG
jgi:CDP-diacylglycerol--glycerol-3-phosphate 3-phosphatidyltransferase